MSHLDQSIPVFALDDDCVMSGSSFDFSSVDDVALCCVRRVSEICQMFGVERQNPADNVTKIDIILAGWSYGGVITSLIAQHVASSAHSDRINVKQIILFDPPLRARAKYSGEEIIPVLNATPSAALNVGQNELLTDRTVEERADYHFTCCTTILKIFQMRSHVETLVQCPLFYIFPEESEYICGTDAAKEMTNGAVKSAESPGTHWTMLFGKNAVIVADMVMKYLKSDDSCL